MFFVCCFSGRVDEDVIDENDDELIKIRSEDTIHQIHEEGWCVGQPKWHDQELIQSVAGSEGRLLNVFLSNTKLVIAGPEVYLRKVASTAQLVKKVINSRHRVFILDGDRVQFPV